MLSTWRIKWPAPKIQLGWKFSPLLLLPKQTGQLRGQRCPPWHQFCCLPSRRSFRPHHISCIAEADDMFVGSLMSFSSREIHTKSRIENIARFLITNTYTRWTIQATNKYWNKSTFSSKSLIMAFNVSLGFLERWSVPPCSYRTGRWNAHFFGMKLNFKSGPSWCFLWFIRRYVLCPQNKNPWHSRGLMIMILYSTCEFEIWHLVEVSSHKNM